MPRLMRPALEPIPWQHPGLLLDRGLPALPENPGERGEALAGHVRRVCQCRIPAIYRKAYERFERLTDDETRFARWFGRIDGRLFIGLGMPHVLEIQVTLNRIYGVPLIPGSALKGLARRGAQRLGIPEQARSVLFGREGKDPEDFAAGYLVFHDALWVPDSAPTPLVPEVVTVHHQDYYQGQGAASPCDAPNPNHQIAVRGSFLFAIEAPRPWADLGLEALREALTVEGAGAKTAAGYGFFTEDREAQEKAIRHKEAEAERRQREEQARRLEALSENERRLHDLRVLLEKAQRTLPQIHDQEIHTHINALLAEAWRWPEEERQQAARLIEQAYDLVGWHVPGAKSKQKQKQRAKKEKRIQALREGRQA